MMKLCLAISLLVSLTTYAQDSSSLSPRPANTPQDITALPSLLKASKTWTYTDPEQATRYAEEALLLAKSLHIDTGEVRALAALGFAQFVAGSYSKALKNSLEGLKRAEEIHYPTGIALACNNLGNIYRRQQNYPNAVSYFSKAIQIYGVLHDETALASVLSNLGGTYLYSGQTDSAMYYLQAAYQKSLQTRFIDIPLTYNRLGDLHYQLKNIALALEYYRLGVISAQAMGNSRWLCFNYLSMAELFSKENNIDSSIVYGKKALAIGQNKFLQQQLQVCTILSDNYTRLGVADSALKYLRLVMAIKDTILNNREESDIQNLLFEERLRSLQAQEEQLQQQAERSTNLQYAAIAIGLISFLVLFFLLSRSIITNTKVIVFMGILALLIVFEFLNLLLHPYLGALTHHQPLLMLGAMVIIAALLIPLHHRLEHWVTHKLVEKNKRIRLAAAKKTIQELEGTTTPVAMQNSTKA